MSFPLPPPMARALAAARAAGAAGEVPVGACVVKDGEVIATAANAPRALNDPTAHAEMLVLREGAAKLGGWRLREATLYVTLEPCPMCAGAAWASSVGAVVYGAADMRAGAMGSLYNLAVDQRLNHTTEVVAGVRADEAAALLTDFFADRR